MLSTFSFVFAWIVNKGLDESSKSKNSSPVINYLGTFIKSDSNSNINNSKDIMSQQINIQSSIAQQESDLILLIMDSANGRVYY